MEYSYHSRFRRPSTLLAAAIGLIVLAMGIMQGVAWYWLAVIALPLAYLLYKLVENPAAHLIISDNWIKFKIDGQRFSAMKTHIHYVQLPARGIATEPMIVLRDGTYVVLPEDACPKLRKLERELTKRGYDVQLGGSAPMSGLFDDSLIS